MPFTAAGKTADLELGTAEDLPKTKQIKELGREPTVRSDGSRGQLATYQIDLTVENTRSEKLVLDVQFDVLGQIQLAQGATISKTAAIESAENPSTRASWHFLINPREKKELRAVYRIVI